MSIKSTTSITLLLAATLASMPFSTADAQDQISPEAEQPSRLNPPEWNPDPEDLPPELRPMDVVRPVLPEDVAAEVAELEARMAQIEGAWLEAETRDAQDAAMDEAIGLAERVLSLRQEHQGNSDELIRWRDGVGEANEWHEVIVARQKVADLRLYRELGDADRVALASIVGSDDEVRRLFGEGSDAEAQAVTERQLEVRRHVLGDEHPETLTSINNIGILLESQGRLAEAEPYYYEALEGFRRVLGDEHPDTLRCTNNIGSLLESQGKLSEAEPYYRAALEGLRRVLGDNDPATLTFINNMGSLRRSQGKLSEAEPYYREALKGNRRVLGGDHPDTLISINNVGILLSSQGKLSQAEPYRREALEGSRRVLGDEHPFTLSCISNMGVLLESQGQLSEAEPYYREALEVRRRVLVGDHPDTLIAINNVGILLSLQGKLSEAEPYHLEALEGSRRVLGGEHPFTLSSISNMGVLLETQGRLSEAEPYAREGLEGNRRVLGNEHPNTLSSMSNMGVLLESQGQLSEAEPYYREALEGSRRVLGNEHPATLISIKNMGDLFSAQGKLSEAEPYYLEALATAERLRVDIAGDALARAQFAGELRLPQIAMEYARTLVSLDRPSEALGVLERGRGRAGLDLFAGGRSAAEEALRATTDAAAIARYDAALTAEVQARLALVETEASLSVAPDTDKSARRDEMLEARRTLAEKTAAVFIELRGLVPAVDPMTAEQMLAELGPGEALLTWAWTDDGVIALVAKDGEVTGMSLADDKEETQALSDALEALRGRIAERPSGGEAVPEAVRVAALEAAAPEELRELLTGASSVIAVTDGPMAGISVELLLPETPVAYAPTATIALRPRLEPADATSAVSSSGVIVGDPVYAGFEREEPDYPETGILIAIVTEDSNAAVAGLTRGDVLLTYGGHELESAADLAPAIGVTAETMATGGVGEQDRPVTARVWRDGQEIEVSLALGRLGVQLSEAPPAEGLRSMATFDRPADELAANATALEQIRFYGGGLSPLPATRLEAAAIASMLGEDTKLLLGPDATAPKLRAAVQASPPRVIHLATHGLLGSADRPLLASIALTTPEEPSAEDNGFVTLGDILATWGGQLRDTELVTLSACDTASAVRQGDTMMALPLGLLISGADTVVASLWKVDDKATALLMARFYSNWLGKAETAREIDGASYSPGQPMPKLAALREAQQWLRGLTRDEVEAITGSPDAVNESVTRDPKPRRGRLSETLDPDATPYAHPFYWSAFVLYGQSK